MMKKLPVYLCALGLFFVFSCQKSNSGGSVPSSNYYISSVVEISPQQRIIDSFYYDTLHRVDTFTQVTYDTTSGTPMYDSWTGQFLYQGASSFPSYYNLYDQSRGNYGDYHILSYDQDNRIIKDTSYSGSGYVTYYTYPGNNITSFEEPEGTAQDNILDSLYITNGNISTQAVYLSVVPGQPDQEQGFVHYTDASIANPAYHQAIAGSIGPLLTTLEVNGGGSFVDFISKNAFQSLSGVEASAPSVVALTYNLTTDSKGRLSQMTAGTGASYGTISYYYY